jgi:DNA-binding MarR family transcriptional regulator
MMAASTGLKAIVSSAKAVKQTPAEVSLTLSAEILRAPYSPATRLVLAEIVSLHGATGDCYCSDAHFAARLTISATTASRAVQELEMAGLIQKQVDKVAGNRRRLIPVATAIREAASTNPYPQNGGSYPHFEGRATPKMVVSYPQNECSPTLEMVVGLPPEWGTNTTLNSTTSLQENLILGASAESEPFFEEALSNLLPTEKELVNHTEQHLQSISDTEPSFERFWQAYDKNAGRGQCLKAWTRLAVPERLAAMTAVEAYVVATPELRYRKNPLTWLSGRCWLDEPLPLRPASPSNTLQLPARATTSPTKTKGQSWR